MGLEATMIIVDNSEHTRNGDFTPTRFGAESDAVNLIFTAKTQSNPENTVGIMTLAGAMLLLIVLYRANLRPEVKTTMTKDLGKILQAMHGIKISGSPNLMTALQIAQLALKHRQNKLQKQRIIVFIASPIEDSTQALVRLARKMKKNNISIDVVNFGEEAVNTSKLEAVVEAIGPETSHLVTIPPGSYLLSDMILSSPILMGEDGVPPPGLGAIGGDSSGFEFDIDPNLDPELALALRMSLEEENARQQAEALRQAREAERSNLPSVPEESDSKDESGEGQGGTDSMQIDK